MAGAFEQPGSFQPRCAAAALGLAFGLLAGCSQFDAHRRDLEALHAQGRYDAAATALDDARDKNLYGENNQLLWWLDRGAVALALGNHQLTIETLEKAEAWMELRNQPGAGDAAAQWLLNDTAVPYRGEPYEDMYTNVLKLLAQLESGNVQGGATVEARRLAGKADVLRDRFLKTREALSRRDGAASVPAAGGPVEANPDGEFIESTLGTYLTAVTFMESGDRDLQEVAGRRLQSSIQLQRGLVGDIDETPFAGIGERRPETASVLVVGLSGRCPTKEARTIGPLPLFDYPLYIQLPELVGGSREVSGARAVVESDAGGTSTQELDFVEDMRAVATENHRRALPLIYTRAVLRATLKSAASFAGTQAMRHNAHGDTENLAAIGMVVAGLAFLALTEKADLRCWVFLPGRADVALLDLPPGRHRVRVDYLGATGGVVYSGPWHEVEVGGTLSEGSGDGLQTVVEHYWR